MAEQIEPGHVQPRTAKGGRGNRALAYVRLVALCGWPIWMIASAAFLGWGLAANALLFAIALALVVPRVRAAVWGGLRRPVPERAPWRVAVPLFALSLCGGACGVWGMVETGKRAGKLAAVQERVRVARLVRQNELVDAARSAVAQGETDEAIEAFTGAAEFGALSATDQRAYESALEAHGAALVEADRFEEGLALLERANALSPGSDRLHGAISAAKSRSAVALKKRGDESASKADFVGAIETYKRGLELAPAAEDIQTALQAARERLRAAKQRRQDEQRRAAVLAAIEGAKRVARDKTLCDTPKAIADAWAELRDVRRTDPDYRRAKRAATRLERCRRATGRRLDRGLQEVMAVQRAGIRGGVDKVFLDRGMDVEIRIHGRNKTKITMTNVLFGNRANVHQLTKSGDFLGMLQRVGFKRVNFADGFGATIYFDLDPPSETAGGQKALDELGIGERLVLPATDPRPKEPAVPGPGDLIDPNDLKVGWSYLISQRTPLMPYYELRPKMGRGLEDAVRMTRNLKPGTRITIEARKNIRSVLWFKVSARGQGVATAGWINSTALMGQVLSPAR